MLGTESLYSGQSLLQTVATKGERYYKVRQPASRAALCYYKVEQELLQCGAGLG